VSASRLQLLVATLQRVQRILNAADQVRLAETFAPYLKDSAGHYTYRVKGKEAVQVHLQKVGQTMHALLADLQAGYAAESAYQVLERIFTDNFHLVESVPQLKENKELTSDCLQSVDDLDATYRTKGSGHYKGYVANLTETCDPENELQLITKVQVAPNNVDDAQLLAEALPNLKERTDLATIISDGGFGGEASDKALQEAATITHIQTAIRGAQPDPDKFNLSDFDIQQDEAGKPTTLTCPQGQTVPVTPGRTTGWQARFDPLICATCPFQQDGRCRTQPQKRDRRYLLSFTTKQIRAAQRRKTYLAHRGDSHNLRSAVEATVRSVKHPFPAGKLPVRGQFRIACLMIASAATANVRRIQRCLATKRKVEQVANSPRSEPNRLPDAAVVSFFASAWDSLARWLWAGLVLSPSFAC